MNQIQDNCGGLLGQLGWYQNRQPENTTADGLLASAQHRLREIEAQLANVENLKAEAERLRKIIAAGK